MRLEHMRPHQIRAAIAAHVPAVLPIGVQEYHGEHLPVGVDLLAVTRAVERLEAEAPERLILLPAFAYGAASHAVAGPRGREPCMSMRKAFCPLRAGFLPGF